MQNVTSISSTKVILFLVQKYHSDTGCGIRIRFRTPDPVPDPVTVIGSGSGHRIRIHIKKFITGPQYRCSHILVVAITLYMPAAGSVSIGRASFSQKIFSFL
jgi:hypothetical protein